ncbi:MAG: hypothetical protein LBE24_03070 [Methylobacillus sp.]|jgi:ATP-dependent protease Clp ATPase subunit|nr:hypothetical protein [Methylobacillus sp.]
MKVVTTHEKTLSCSFCGKSQHDVDSLISESGVYICNECVKACNDLVGKKLQGDSTIEASHQNHSGILFCAFCGRSRYQVKYLFADDNGAFNLICDECIDLCNDIIRERKESDKDAASKPVEQDDPTQAI